MEEILASIRRIISEDDAPAAEAGAAPPEPPGAEPDPAPTASAAPETRAEDVLELTERVEPPAETVGDLDVYAKEAAAAPPPRPTPPPRTAPAPETPAPAALRDDGLVGEVSARAAASAFSQLSAAVAMPSDGQTLDGVVRELLRPLLKAWLDEHLPSIVEAKVAEEVERISRIRVR